MLDGSPAPATINCNRRVVSSSMSALAEDWLGAGDADVDRVTGVLETSEELATTVDDGVAVNDAEPTSVVLVGVTADADTDEKLDEGICR